MKALAQRYAAALVDVALEQGAAQRVRSELAAFAGLLGESADLRNFLASPAVPRPAKQAALEKIVNRMGASRTLLNFLFVVIDHHRAPLLPQIQQAFEELLHARLGIVEAQVTSVEELSAAQREELTRRLEQLTGKKVESRYALDPSLIAGAIVRIGSTIYDGSVRDQLKRLEARLTSE